MASSYRVCEKTKVPFPFQSYLFFARWYDTLFPRIPVPTQKEIMEKLHAHGPYKGGNHGAHSKYVRWQVSKEAII